MDSTAVYIVDKLEAGIVALAEGMKQPTEHVYTTFVYQAMIQGATGLITGLLLTGLSVFLYRKLRKAWHAYQKTAEDSQFGASLLLSILLAISAIGAVTELRTGILYLIAPEYYAMEKILAVLK